MKKDFDGWNEYKKKVEKRSQVHIKTREIWKMSIEQFNELRKIVGELIASS